MTERIFAMPGINRHGSLSGNSHWIYMDELSCTCRITWLSLSWGYISGARAFKEDIREPGQAIQSNACFLLSHRELLLKTGLQSPSPDCALICRYVRIQDILKLLLQEGLVYSINKFGNVKWFHNECKRTQAEDFLYCSRRRISSHHNNFRIRMPPLYFTQGREPIYSRKRKIKK